MLGEQYSFDPAQVLPWNQRCQACLAKKTLHLNGLPLPDLDREMSSRGDQLGSRHGNQAVSVEAVPAAVEGQFGLVAGYLRHQSGDRAALDIGGIGHHEVERPVELIGPSCLAPVAGDEFSTDQSSAAAAEALEAER